MRNTTIQQPLTTVSPNSNPTIVFLLAKAGFVSKYNVVPFCCPCPPLIAPLAVQMPVVSSQGLMKQWTPYGHSTLLKTASNGTSGYRIMRNRLNLLCYGSRCGCVINAIRTIRLSSRAEVQRGGWDRPRRSAVFSCIQR
ncbi:hypothetical protein TNCV_3223691 [Trichonephila clavipes]|nr:hypothetical protein TNCV_3223691 [Trichonephila clavipes]